MKWMFTAACILGCYSKALCGTATCSETVEPACARRVNVIVENHAGIPEGTIWQAEAGASKIFQRAGLQLVWNRATPCTTPRRRGAIVVVIADHARDHTPAGIVAYAVPGKQSIVVIYDRIQPTLLALTEFGPALMSYILAHEIAHLLQLAPQHSDTGILKPHWTYADYREMSQARLAFTERDAALMRAGVARGCNADRQSSN